MNTLLRPIVTENFELLMEKIIITEGIIILQSSLHHYMNIDKNLILELYVDMNVTVAPSDGTFLS